jgi:hypothetical protein
VEHRYDPRQRNKREENEAIKKGETPAEWSEKKNGAQRCRCAVD